MLSVAVATILGLGLGAWRGYRLGRVVGQEEELCSACAFLLGLASSPTAETHSPRELAERIGGLEHRRWTLK